MGGGGLGVKGFKHFYCRQIFTLGPYVILNTKQEESSKKLIVETKTALLSLKKDSGIHKGPNDEDWASVTQEGPKCPKNWYRNDYKKWDRNDLG